MSAWLLLASILVHALVPVGSPLVRSWGSAFAATTAEVSLAGSRKAGKPVLNRVTKGGDPQGVSGAAGAAASTKAGCRPAPPRAAAVERHAFDLADPAPARRAPGAVKARAPPISAIA